MKWIPMLAAVAAGLAENAIAQVVFAGREAGQQRIDNGVKLPLRWCPPGEFVMGAPDGEPGREHDEVQHKVRLTQGFWMGETEVTQGQWQSVTGLTLRDQARKMLADPTLYRLGGKDIPLREAANAAAGKNAIDSVCAAEAPGIPVYYVSWDDAMTFCRKLTVAERAAKRLPADSFYSLPTEAQWEYACRAGTTTATYAGDMVVLGENNATVLNDIAWYGGNNGVGYRGRGWTTDGWPNQAFPGKMAGPRRVGQKQPNPWHLCDMLGNLWEWVEDYSGYYPEHDVTDPRGPATGTKKTYRGGSWNHYAIMSRAARRFEDFPTFRVHFVGFRIALRLNDAEKPPDPLPGER